VAFLKPLSVYGFLSGLQGKTGASCVADTATASGSVMTLLVAFDTIITTNPLDTPEKVCKSPPASGLFFAQILHTVIHTKDLLTVHHELIAQYYYDIVC
jgi:hypothetical protein